jgi:hypothetical protein
MHDGLLVIDADAHKMENPVDIGVDPASSRRLS